MSPGSQTLKDELVDSLCRAQLSKLEPALVDVLTRRDLQTMCGKVRVSSAGPKHALAARLVAAVEDVGVTLTRWRSFRAARAFVRTQNLGGHKMFREMQRPTDIPSAPHTVYAESGWAGWGDFLGTGNPARHLIVYRPFRQARAYARSHGLASANEWRAFCKRKIGNRRLLPADIPATPYNVYRRKGWKSFGDWLGTGTIHSANVPHRSHAAARRFVQKLRIRSETEYRAYCRGEIHRSRPRPRDVPSNPQRTYRDRGWKSWGHFFGTGALASYQRTFMPFRQARAHVRRLKLRNNKAWRAWCKRGKRPPGIPGAPEQVYRDRGWVSWGDFLGNGNPTRWKLRR